MGALVTPRVVEKGAGPKGPFFSRVMKLSMYAWIGGMSVCACVYVLSELLCPK